MKKLIQKLPLASIVLIIFAGISLVWAAQQKEMVVEEELFNEIVFLENAEYNEENEGKIVAVYSDLGLLKGPTEPGTGLNVNCGILIRDVGMYQYTLIDDSVYRMYTGQSEKNIRGLHGEVYENPEFPEEYKKEVMLGDVCIGEGDLLLGADLLQKLVVNSPESGAMGYRLLNPEIEIPGFTKDADGVFTNTKGEKTQIGDMKIRYYYLTLKSLGEVLVVGRQKGNEIVADSESISVISTTAKNIDELKAELANENHSSNAKGLETVAIVEAVAAVGIFIISKVRKNKRRV